MLRHTLITLFAVTSTCFAQTHEHDHEHVLHQFSRVQLTDTYFSEGANFGDINNDGVMDVVHGPYWFAGPDFKTKHEIYPAKPQDRNKYADNFFSWVRDFDRDGWNDVLVVGFPGTPAFVYENPGSKKHDATWPKHTVLDWVSNESPQFINIVGDETPELVCTRDGRFGYATIPQVGQAVPDETPAAFARWDFHPISKDIAPKRFGHGLGVGDVNNDGRQDLIFKDGWFEQPEDVSGDPKWKLHQVKFSAPGGADMFTYDVDGDGDNDVITSLGAHDYGLVWHEQQPWGKFKQHTIMGRKPSDNKYGVLFTEPHAVKLVDIDGDGLKDIVTGKTYWSHHKQSPMWDAGAVVYWFKLKRTYTDQHLQNRKALFKMYADFYEHVKEEYEEDVGNLPHPKTATMLDVRRILKILPDLDSIPDRKLKKPVRTKVDWLPYKADGEAGIGRQLTVGDINGDQLPDIVVGGMKGAHVLLHERREVSDAEWHAAQPVEHKELASGLSPEDAAKNMTVPPGFKVQLAAGEPMVHQPIAFTFDDRGRLWLAEAYTYPNRAKDGEGKDKIVILEDTDLDGDFDKRTVFIEGLNLVSGLEVGFGGVWVGAAPYLMFIPDRDGDDKPDTPVAMRSEPMPPLPRRDSRRHAWTSFGGEGRGEGARSNTQYGNRVPKRDSEYPISNKEFPTRKSATASSGGATAGDSLGFQPEVPRSTNTLSRRATTGGPTVQIGPWIDPPAAAPRLNQHSRHPFLGLKPEATAYRRSATSRPANASLQPSKFLVRHSAVQTDPLTLALSPATNSAESSNIASGGEGTGALSNVLGASEPQAKTNVAGTWGSEAPGTDQSKLQFPKDVPPGATVLLDGFGWHDTHEVLNSFIWGPDGWLYGCHGIFTHSKVGKPGTPDDKRTPLNAGVWRYHPQRHEFEVFAEGTSNPWGVDFNEKGDAFITACVIPHLYHVIPGARYQRQAGQHFNPHTYDDIKTIADHLHYTGNIKDHAWWGHEPDVPKGTDDAGGGHAHCGAMVYLGDNWPKEYRGKLFFNNIHGNRINTDILEPKGSGYVGRHGKDFLKANDRWFRGINMKYAPDGTVYLIDWYDKNACHRTNPEIWDRTNGRIYRIVYGDKKPERVNLGAMSTKKLISLQTHENEWFSRTAMRLLQERGLDDGERAFAQKAFERYLGLESLDDRQAMIADRLARLLIRTGSGGPGAFDGARGWMTIEQETRHGISKSLRGSLDAVGFNYMRNGKPSGPSPTFKLWAAMALQRIPVTERWPYIEKLLVWDDSDDHNLPLMYWYAIEPLVPADPARAVKLAEASNIPLITRFIYRRAASDDKLIDYVIQSLVKSKEEMDFAIASEIALLESGSKPVITVSGRQELVLDEMSRAFEGRVNIPMPPAWKPAYNALTKSENPAVRDKADRIAILLGDARIFPRMRARLVDKNEPIQKRREALDILVRGRDDGAADSWLAVLNEPQLRGPAIRALAAIDDARTAPALIGQYGSLADSERRDAVSTLVARKSSALALLDAIEAKKIPSIDLHAYHIRELDRFKDDKLNARIKSVWGDIRESSADKKKQIADMKAMLTAPTASGGRQPGDNQNHTPDLGNGRRLFDKTCASCHMLFGSGGKVGPDITGSNRANLDYILENVIDPSAVMGRDYRMSTFLLEDGRSVSGIVQRETDSALTVRTINDTIVIAKDDIDDQTQSELSLMPERLLDSLKENEVRDLIAYLASPVQVAAKGPRSPIDPKTNRVSGAIEGESMKLLKVTRGRATGQPMAQFKGDRWSNNDHIWWIDGELGDTLTLELPVKETGTYDMELVMTRTVDYGIFQLMLDGKEIGSPIDLYNKEVTTTGVLTIPVGELKSGPHKFTAKIIGANPKAIKRYMFGLDYIRLIPK